MHVDHLRNLNLNLATMGPRWAAATTSLGRAKAPGVWQFLAGVAPLLGWARADAQAVLSAGAASTADAAAVEGGAGTATTAIGLCVLGLCALIAWAWWRRRARRTGPNAGKKRSAVPLEHMGPREFEVLLAQAFRMQGFQVSNGREGNDGVDLVLRKDRQTHLVRTRDWQLSKVGADAVEDLRRVTVARGAAGGIVVTRGRFSREATALAQGCNVRLIEGRALELMIRQASAQP